jgi:hypothetical protein
MLWIPSRWHAIVPGIGFVFAVSASDFASSFSCQVKVNAKAFCSAGCEVRNGLSSWAYADSTAASVNGDMRAEGNENGDTRGEENESESVGNSSLRSVQFSVTRTRVAVVPLRGTLVREKNPARRVIEGVYVRRARKFQNAWV